MVTSIPAAWSIYVNNSQIHFSNPDLSSEFQIPASKHNVTKQVKFCRFTFRVEGPCCCSVAQSCLTLWPHGPQHASLPCPSLSPRACSHSWPLSQWYHPTISSSVVPFSSCPQSFPASGSFLMSQLFTSGGQSTGASTSPSVLLMNIQDWFPLGLTGFISLQPKGLSRVFSNPTAQKHQFSNIQPSLLSNSPIYIWLQETP